MADIERRTYSIVEAAKLLGVGKDTAYRQAHTGELAGVPVMRIMGRMVIPAARLDAALGINRPKRRTA